MEFPIDVWRIIKEYQIPYRAYWMGNMHKCIRQLDSSLTPPGVVSCMRAGGRRRRRRSADDGLDLMENLWWRTRFTQIKCVGQIHSGPFVYYHNLVRFPDGIRRRQLTIDEIRRGRSSMEIVPPAKLLYIANY